MLDSKYKYKYHKGASHELMQMFALRTEQNHLIS